jgi:hypothetical protein
MKTQLTNPLWSWLPGLITPLLLAAAGQIELSVSGSPTAPARIGGYRTSGMATGIVLVDKYAYVSDGPAGLQVIDVSNPASPVRVGGCATGGMATAIAAMGQFILIQDQNSGLEVIDVSNPASPVRVSQYQSGNTSYSLAVSGQYALVGDEEGLQVIDVSNPAKPIHVNGYLEHGHTLDVTVHGLQAYVADEEGLQVFEVSDAANPEWQGGISLRLAGAIGVDSHYAYVFDTTFVISGFNVKMLPTLDVIDISNPANPVRLGGCTLSTDSIASMGSGIFAIYENYVYLADKNNGVQIIDVSNPSQPRPMGQFAASTNAWSIVVTNDIAFVAEANYGLSVFRLNATETHNEPQISQAPASQTATIGSAASFSITVNGVEPMHYQWFHQGDLISGQTQSNLVLNLVGLNDEGSYVVVITNAYGAVTSAPAMLTMTGDVPQFFSPIRDQSVAQGQKLVLFSPALGWEPIHYQWFFNHQALPGSNQFELVFSSAQTPQSGSYYLIVSNYFGKNTSLVANISVLPPLKVTTVKTTNLIERGSNLVLRATVEGAGPYHYQWQINGEAIPGATNATWAITKALPQDSGAYRIVVANAAEAIAADIAEVIVLTAQAPPEDAWSARQPLAGSSGFVASSNSFATFEPGEPQHAGKPGGRSIWFNWTAPDRGNLTLRTTGSSFDTLLAVYQGTRVDQLELMASDEDSGGYLTSALTLPVQTGQEYAIAVDGFAGATGRVLLEWQLEITAEDVPQIVGHPTNTVVGLGQSNRLAIVARGTNLKYQWYQNDSPVAGATQSQLVVTNAQPSHAGSYRVAVINEHNTRTNLSQHASLEVYQLLEGAAPEVTPGQDKTEDLGLDSTAVPTPQSLSPVAGYTIVTWSANLNDTTPVNENSNGQTVEYNTRVFKLNGPQSGTWMCTLSTEGSEFDTILEVKKKQGRDLILVAINDDSAPGVLTSKLQFIAPPGSEYTVVVGGKNRAKGKFQLKRWFEPQQRYWLTQNQRREVINFGLQVPRGWAFQVDESHDLKTWSPYYSATSSSGSYELKVKPEATAGSRFYRALLSIPTDVYRGNISGMNDNY